MKKLTLMFFALSVLLLNAPIAQAQTQLNGVTVRMVRINDKDNVEFRWYGVICFNATTPGDFGDCGAGSVYCVTEGEAYGRGMVAVALSAQLAGRRVNVRSTANQCDMVEMLSD